MFSKKIKTVFDVGASEGTFLRAFANNKSYKVYAFEPIIEKAYALAGRWDNVHVLPISIDECESWREFFFNEYSAASSLLEIDKNVLVSWQTAGHDLSKTTRRTVLSRRLDTICMDRGIREISILKIDTQGNDLRVLRSAGDYLAKTSEIIIEAPTGDIPLYSGGATRVEIEKFLFPQGFRLIREEQQSLGQEVNLYFKK